MNTENRLDQLEAFAWPGGYPILYATIDNETLCVRCAQEVVDGGGRPVPFIFYEGAPEFCAGCNLEVSSAYGEPNDS